GCECRAGLCLRGAVVQSLACFAWNKSYLFRALSLAMAQTSSRVSYHPSRNHYAADRIAYRQNLGNRRNDHTFQRRTANESAFDQRTPAARPRCRWNSKRLSRRVFTSSADTTASTRPWASRERRAFEDY